jgi:uncharacterized protein (DUF1778 family)
MERVQLRLDEHVTHGSSQILVRIRHDDKSDIIKAAALLGLSQSQFIRNVLVQTARVVIAEKESEAA